MLLPLSDYVLLKEIEAVTMSKGGIHIPETAQQKFNQGTVIAFGPAVTPDQIATAATVGEVAVFPLHVEYRVRHKDQPFILVRVTELMAKITDDSASE